MTGPKQSLQPMKTLVILGSTGSIGAQTLEVVRQNPAEFRIVGLTANSNEELLKKQAREFGVKHVLLASNRPSRSSARQLMSRRNVGTPLCENSRKELMDFAQMPEADLVVNAVSGSAGLMLTYAACKAGKKIALANKESLVMAGELIMSLASQTGAQILPVDSEMSALWQILDSRCYLEQCYPELVSGSKLDSGSSPGMTTEDVEKLFLTASGGPFYGWKREDLQKVTPKQALNHPTWKMGGKISVDSATLMNKALEIIEARWLFNVPPEKIDVLIHRQSIVHSLVQFNDGSTQAVLAAPDMKIPISYALHYPERRVNNFPRVDFSKLQLTFENPDYSIFEGPKLAYEVLKEGGIMPAVLCLADEIAVSKFRAGEIPFFGIYDFIKRALSRVKNTALSFEALEDLSLSL